MPFATINGITLPIRDGSLKQSTQEIGERGQAFDGTAYQAVRARKRKWQFSTPPMSQADSLAWSALIGGQGVNWSFEADTYSLQGHAATTSGSPGTSASQKKFGARSLLMGAGATASWSLGFGAQWSIAYWHYASSWAHIVKTSGGTTYVNGVSSGSVYPGSVSAGTVAFAAVSTIFVDDLIAIPAVVPASWPAQMYAHGAQLIDASGFTLGGDIVPAAVACVGQVTGSKVLQGIVGGSWVSNAVELDVEIVEA